jgi:anti-anti-sigma regulatory factor
MTLHVQTERSAATGGFDVRTARCDATRANLHLSGDLDDGAAAVLDHVIDGHVRAGRRFLRLHVGGLRSLGGDAVNVIARAHDRLLAVRGTMILTGVGGPVEAALRAAAPGSPLFMLPPNAAEHLN